MNKQEPLKVIAGTPDRPLIINGIEIDCYVLEDETRVLSQSGLFRSIGITKGGQRSGPRSDLESAGAEMPRFAAQKWLSPFISNKLIAVLKNPILFNPPAGRMAYGYPATALGDICNAIFEAHQQGATTTRQAPIVERAMILIRGLVTVGVIALVDEATGYQEIREQNALATILEKFIDQELQPWTMTFPYEFYRQIFRLRGWPGPDGVKRPSVIGKYTNDIVYERIAPGVLEELKSRNPTQPSGGRQHKHHQWFTPDHGHPRLREHLTAAIALMRASTNWDDFQRNLNRGLPRPEQSD